MGTTFGIAARTLIAFASFATLGACGTRAHPEDAFRAASRVHGRASTVDELARRYRALWASVDPSSADAEILMAHPGISDGARLIEWIAVPGACGASGERLVGDDAPSAADAGWNCRITVRARRASSSASWAPVEVGPVAADGAFGTLRYELVHVGGGALSPGPYDVEVTVARRDDETQRWTRTSRHVVPPPTNATSPSRVSFLAWSCNEPWGFDRHGGVLESHVNSYNLLRIRTKGTLSLVDDSGRAWEPPSFGLAIGDQIYVDPDPKEDEGVAFFWGPRSNRFALDLTDASIVRRAFDLVYRRTFTIPPLNDALESLPTAMVWDDHDIRDGWGSQGDESNPQWQLFFDEAARGYAAFQTFRNPGDYDYDPAHRPVHGPAFRWGERVHVLLLDQRSHRDDRQAMGGAQLDAMERWLRDAPPADRGRLFVLGSPIPISLYNSEHVVARRAGKEDGDDLRDRLDAKPDEFRDLLTRLTRHFRAHPDDRLLVLSGDIHESGLFLLRLCETGDCDRTGASTHAVDFGWEVVTSGLANDRHTLPAFVRRIIGSVSRSGIHPTAKNIDGEFSFAPLARGAIEGAPSFVEVLVDDSPEIADAVSVVFYPSAWTRGVRRDPRLGNTYGDLESSSQPIPTIDDWDAREPPALAHSLRLLRVHLPAHSNASAYFRRPRRGWVSTNLHRQSMACRESADAATELARGWTRAPVTPGTCEVREASP